jgi:hypothetical protein
MTTVDPAIQTLSDWMNEIAAYWKQEIPLRIHSRDTGDDGAPAWHAEFARWMFAPASNDRRWDDHHEPRVRTTRAMRKLREQHPREYEVLYRSAILQIPLTVTVNWLNDRAERNNKPERYTLRDTVMILMVAADKVACWW